MEMYEEYDSNFMYVKCREGKRMGLFIPSRKTRRESNYKIGKLNLNFNNTTVDEERV